MKRFCISCVGLGEHTLTQYILLDSEVSNPWSLPLPCRRSDGRTQEVPCYFEEGESILSYVHWEGFMVELPSLEPGLGRGGEERCAQCEARWQAPENMT